MVKILIVDDEKSICETLSWMLEKEGYIVYGYGDFEAAKEAIEASDFDIYIVDIFLPGRNGIDLIKLIKNLGKSGVIIIITGYPNVPTLIDSIRLDVFDYIKKPISHEHLKKVIDHILLLQDELFGNEIKDPYLELED